MYNKQFMDEEEQNIAIYQITADILWLDRRGLVGMHCTLSRMSRALSAAKQLRK